MKTKPIEVEFGCFGYYGFGGGVSMMINGSGPAGETYCNQCPLRNNCWNQHRIRVREMLPAVVELFDEYLARYGNGQEAVKHFIDDHGTEPYMAMMMGNMEDGAAVATGGWPRDRARFTLPWPLPVIPQNQ